jgi:hypothetical protein
VYAVWIEDGKLILELDPALFKVDSMERLLGTSFKVQSTTEKVECKTALPVTAIVHKDHRDYIYMVNKKQGFWEEEYRVEETEVNISIYNNHYAAVAILPQIFGWIIL